MILQSKRLYITISFAVKKITEINAFEFAVEYRSLLKEIRNSISEGLSDLE